MFSHLLFKFGRGGVVMTPPRFLWLLLSAVLCFPHLYLNACTPFSIAFCIECSEFSAVPCQAQRWEMINMPNLSY